jgi:hypothetical protein
VATNCKFEQHRGIPDTFSGELVREFSLVNMDPHHMHVVFKGLLYVREKGSNPEIYAATQLLTILGKPDLGRL